MFDFIVSGHVPGTHLDLTFTEVYRIIMLAAAVGLSWYELRYHRAHKRLDIDV